MSPGCISLLCCISSACLPATTSAASSHARCRPAPPLLQAETEARERCFVQALLLAFFASQNRSLFAGGLLLAPRCQMPGAGTPWQ